MDVTSTRARLVDALAPDEASLTAMISRAEIESAIAADEPAELWLDVVHDAKPRTVSVLWEKADLERLLGEADSSSVRLTFDRAELEHAILEADFEGHGLREKVLVLTVAAAAAAGVASSAAAAPDPAGAGMVDRGVEVQRAAAAADTASIVDRGVDVQRAAAAESDLAAMVDRGVEVQRAAAASDAQLASMVDRGVQVQQAAAASEASMVDRGIEMQRAAALDEQPAPGDGGWAIDTPSIDPTTAAVTGGIVGGIALLITAAGFSITRNRPRPL
jgi:hypothetical protein